MRRLKIKTNKEPLRSLIIKKNNKKEPLGIQNPVVMLDQNQVPLNDEQIKTLFIKTLLSQNSNKINLLESRYILIAAILTLTSLIILDHFYLLDLLQTSNDRVLSLENELSTLKTAAPYKKSYLVSLIQGALIISAAVGIGTGLYCIFSGKLMTHFLDTLTQKHLEWGDSLMCKLGSLPIQGTTILENGLRAKARITGSNLEIVIETSPGIFISICEYIKDLTSISTDSNKFIGNIADRSLSSELAINASPSEVAEFGARVLSNFL